MKPKNRKTIAVSIAALTVAAGTIVGVGMEYNARSSFQPFSSNQKLQSSQVLFPDTENGLGADQNSEDSDSFWEKNDNSDDTLGNGTNTGYLFNQEESSLPDSVPSGALSQGNTGMGDSSNTPSGNQNEIYEIGGNGSGSSPDLIVPGGGSGGQIIGGTTGGGSLDSGGSGSGNGNGNTGNNGTGDNGNSGGNSGTNTGDNTGDNTGGGEDPNPTPSNRYENIKDPEVKRDPGREDFNSGGSGIPGRPYEESKDEVAKIPEDSKVVMIYPTINSYTLYQGQEINELTLFNAVTAYVGDTASVKAYYWTADDLGTYIRVAGISFDGGETIHDASEFPITVPKEEGLETCRVYYEYRFDENDDWTRYVDSLGNDHVEVTIESYRLFLLDEKLADDAESIDQDHVMFSDHTVMTNDFETVGKINLFYCVSDLFTYRGEDPDNLTHLFPGWEENGEAVDWYYDTERPGRHILEPADPVDLDPAYTAALQLAWLDENYDDGGYNLSYLQTLTGWSGGREQKAERGEPIVWYQQISETLAPAVLKVPEYIQAITVDRDNAFEVDELVLPSTVLLVADNEYLRVNNRYTVAEDNPYLSSEYGMLFNKEKTVLMAIPYEAKEIRIPAGVQKVQLSSDNALTSITFEETDEENLPNLNLSYLSGVTLRFESEDLMVQYAADHKKELDGIGLAVGDGAVYHLTDNMLIDQENGTLHRILPDATVVTIPASVRAIETGAFDGSSARIVVMSADEAVTLQPGSLSGSLLEKYICKSKTQAEEIESQRDSAGAPEDMIVAYGETKNGYTYYTDDDGSTTLLSAPADAVRFDETTLPDVKITTIADQAFRNCASLQWVILPESVSRIGTMAFEDCSALEGVLINNEESITIGDEAFEGCSALRFVASNAVTAEMENGYDPRVYESGGGLTTEYTCFFFIPADGWGYGFNTTAAAFGETYEFLEDGDNKFLAAVSRSESDLAPADSENETDGASAGSETVRILRSGKTLNGALAIPKTTTRIDEFALSYTEGSFTVDWENLPNLFWIGNGAFCVSGLEGEVHLISANTYLVDYAFYGCPGITKVTVDHTASLGSDLFGSDTALKSVSFLDMENGQNLYYGMFNNCESLTDLTLDSADVPKLVIPGLGNGFQFNYVWSADEEAEHLSIHLREGSDLLEYIKEWRYYFAGYYSFNYDTPYLEMWNALNMTWIRDDFSEEDDVWRLPTDQETDMLAKLALLSAENNIRTMLGCDTVVNPVDFYAYRIEYSGDMGYLTLTDACTDETEITLDWSTVDMPEGWYLDYLGMYAFASSPQLTKVTVNDPLPGIHEGAVWGLNGDFTLVLNDTTDSATSLLLNEEGSPFEFGMDTDKLHVVVPEDRKEEYYNSWIYPLAGYSDLWSLYDAVMAELGFDADFDAILARVDEILEPVKATAAKILDYTVPEEVDEELQAVTEGMIRTALAGRKAVVTAEAEAEKETEAAESTEAAETTKSAEPSETESAPETKAGETGNSSKETKNDKTDETNTEESTKDSENITESESDEGDTSEDSGSETKSDPALVPETAGSTEKSKAEETNHDH